MSSLQASAATALLRCISNKEWKQEKSETLQCLQGCHALHKLQNLTNEYRFQIRLRMLLQALPTGEMRGLR